jgi:hypothetical protein
VLSATFIEARKITDKPHGYRGRGVLSLSVAFTKEDSAETASETLLPDRPVSPDPSLVTEAGLKALEFQLQQAREAYETAQKIEDVNERRRQAATPLHDARYLRREFGRLRSSPILRQLTLSPLGAP